MSQRPEIKEVIVVGATGAVGREFLSVLGDRGHSRRRIRATASKDSIGLRLACGATELTVEDFDALEPGPRSLLLLATDSAMSRAIAAKALPRGARVIDNSSAFRSDPRVPLVIPEVNPGALAAADQVGLIANPNCSTILLLLPLSPIRARFGLRFVSVSTHQAVSGAGRAAMEELWSQSRDVLDGKPPVPRAFALPCAFNVFPHNSPIDPATGANEEERKIVAESRRIWSEPDLPIETNCVRVPVLRAHSQSISFELGQPATLPELREVLRDAPGVSLCAEGEEPPTPLAATSKDQILVGRLRPSLASVDTGSLVDGAPRSHRRYQIWLCGDQLRKGAALNAVQIAEACGWLR